MRSIIFVLTALVLIGCHSKSIIEVVDGDTLRLDGKLLQLAGIEAPDMDGLAACENEMVLGAAAYRHLYELVKQGVTLQPTGQKAGPNTFLVRVYTEDKQSVSEILLDLGLVTTWKGQEHDWCKP